MRMAAVLAAVLALGLTRDSKSYQWRSCATALDELKDASDNSASRARRIAFARSVLENCQAWPNADQNNCSSEMSSYEIALSGFRFEALTLESKLQDASTYCGLSLAPAALVAPAKSRR